MALKIKNCFILPLFGVMLLTAFSCGASRSQEVIIESDSEELNSEEAVPEESVNFSINEINGEILNRIKGKSYKEGCPFQVDELRYLTVAHYDGEGNVKQGEIICNVAIAEDLIDIFRNLFQKRYPIENIRLIDDYDADDIKSMQANNTSCFNYRPIAGSKKLSKHATGMAIDINPLYNPYVKGNNVSPEEGKPYADRSSDFPYKIDREDPCHKEFISHGFKWGGDWKSLKDFQHFEK